MYINFLEKKLIFLENSKDDLLSKKPLIFKKKWNKELKDIEEEEKRINKKYFETIEEFYINYK